MGLSALCSHQGSEGHKKALARLNSPITVLFKHVFKNSKVAPSVDVAMSVEKTAGVSLMSTDNLKKTIYDYV